MLLDEQDAAFYVDVNAADDEDRVGVTLGSVLPGFDLTTREPQIGSHVLAVDADDNVCQAVVVNRKGVWLQLQLDAATWRPLSPSEFRVSLHGADPLDALRAMLDTPPTP